MVEHWQTSEPVKLILRRQEFQVKAGMTLRDCLKKINVAEQSVLAVKNGEMITDDTVMQPGDVIRLVAVVSGG